MTNPLPPTSLSISPPPGTEVRPGLRLNNTVQMEITKDDVIAIHVDKEDSRLQAEQSAQENVVRNLMAALRKAEEEKEKFLVEMKESFIDFVISTYEKPCESFGFSNQLSPSKVSASYSITNTPGSHSLPKEIYWSCTFEISSSMDGRRLSYSFTRTDKQPPATLVNLCREINTLTEELDTARGALLNTRRQRSNLPTMERKARVAITKSMLSQLGTDGQDMLKAIESAGVLPPPVQTGGTVSVPHLDQGVTEKGN